MNFMRKLAKIYDSSDFEQIIDSYRHNIKNFLRIFTVLKRAGLYNSSMHLLSWFYAAIYQTFIQEYEGEW